VLLQDNEKCLNFSTNNIHSESPLPVAGGSSLKIQFYLCSLSHSTAYRFILEENHGKNKISDYKECMVISYDGGGGYENGGNLRSGSK
jgi:hypothetical protein